MPIQAQCCGLILLAILFFFYKSQKRIKLYGERAFLNAFIMTFICIACDILSCAVISNKAVIARIVVDLVSKLYLATMVGVAFFALFYIFTDIYTNRAVYSKKIIKYGIFAGVALIFIFVLPIETYYSPAESMLYSYGPSDYAAYAFGGATFIILAVTLIKDRAKISRVKRSAVIMWLSIWIVALVIQFIFPKLLLTGFACTTGMLVLYLKLENPGNNLDRQTGLFNHGAFLQYSKQMYGSGKKFAVLDIIIEHSSFRVTRAESEDDVIAEIADYLSALPDTLTFINTNNEILLVFSDISKAENCVKVIHSRFESGWGKSRSVLISPNCIYVSDSSIAENTEDLLYLLRYIRTDINELSERHFFEADSDLALRLHKEKDVEELIVSALEDDRVEVWYQPIFSTEAHRFTSAEALVRIRNTDGSMVQPGVFIETAERNGMIMQIGETVFRKVCRYLKQNDISQYGMEYIEVNLSMVQCAYKHLADDYRSIMEEYGVSPKLINLEITESASMNAKKTLLGNMKQLMDYGVSFSLDDFGTGQSNLDYIVDMPVEIVKFDKGMTNAYFENGKAKYIMDAAMNMIRGMDLKIVSEGIESLDQFYTMENLGINYIQGYYFSKPLPEEEFTKFIEEKNGKVQ